MCVEKRKSLLCFLSFVTAPVGVFFRHFIDVRPTCEKKTENSFRKMKQKIKFRHVLETVVKLTILRLHTCNQRNERTSLTNSNIRLMRLRVEKKKERIKKIFVLKASTFETKFFCDCKIFSASSYTRKWAICSCTVKNEKWFQERTSRYVGSLLLAWNLCCQSNHYGGHFWWSCVFRGTWQTDKSLEIAQS